MEGDRFLKWEQKYFIMQQKKSEALRTSETVKKFILAVIMVNRMRRHLKHLDLIRIERNFQDWESITIVDGNPEGRRVRQNMHKTWLSS